MPDEPKSQTDSMPDETGNHDESEVPASRNRRWIIIAAAAVVVIIGAIGGYVFLGGHNEPGTVTIDIGGETVYHEFPEILTQLAGEGTRSDHVKLEIIIEVLETHVGVLQDKQPVIVDAIQAYLRGKTRAELAGEAGAEQLRGELRLMINQRIAPGQVNDILFKTFLID